MIEKDKPSDSGKIVVLPIGDMLSATRLTTESLSPQVNFAELGTSGIF